MIHRACDYYTFAVEKKIRMRDFNKIYIYLPFWEKLRQISCFWNVNLTFSVK